MDSFKIKNGISRFFKNIKIGTIGAIGTTALLISTLLSFASQLILAKNGGIEIDYTDFIFLIINAVFYLYLSKYFITSRDSNKLGPAKMAILVLLFSDYIFPTIQSLFYSMFLESEGAAIFGTLLSGAIFGICYFIFVILQDKRIGKHNYLILTIFGALLLISAIIKCVLYFYTGVQYFTGISEGGEMAMLIIMGITLILEAIGSLCFGFVYLLFPIFSLREEKRGY